MKTLQKSNGAAEINRLHLEILNTARTCLEKAIEIGALLSAEKAKQGHGQWLPWLKANVQFSVSTAGRYTQCFDNRDKLKFVTMTNLTDAYRLLSSGNERNGPEHRPRKVVAPSLKSIDVETVTNDEPQSANNDAVDVAARVRELAEEWYDQMESHAGIHWASAKQVAEYIAVRLSGEA